MTRHYTLTVAAPDDIAPGDPWVFVRAALEILEPGSGRHALRITQMQDSVLYEHPRLGVEIGIWMVER